MRLNFQPQSEQQIIYAQPSSFSFCLSLNSHRWATQCMLWVRPVTRPPFGARHGWGRLAWATITGAQLHRASNRIIFINCYTLAAVCTIFVHTELSINVLADFKPLDAMFRPLSVLCIPDANMLILGWGGTFISHKICCSSPEILKQGSVSVCVVLFACLLGQALFYWLRIRF